jgi:ribonuclease P protein component
LDSGKEQNPLKAKRYLQEEEAKGGKNFLLKKSLFYMLPRANRLTGRKIFENLKTKGKKAQSASFGLIYLKRKDLLPTRIGFVVSTRVSKKASVRNRIKRTFRKGVKEVLDEMSPSYDILFLVKKSSVKTSARRLTNEISQVFRKVRLLND